MPLVQALLYILSGATVQNWGENLWDMFAPNSPQSSSGLNMKTIFLIVLAAAGAMLLWFIGIKLKIFKKR